jgi:hypothetical protein
MSLWHVSAEGDAPPELHRELADRIGKMLGLVKYGTGASQFNGDDVNGPVHQQAAASASDDVQGEETHE